MPDASRRGVFLSYRRDDAGPYARSMQLQLSQRIPDALIFMDLDSIEPGLDFAEVIEEAVTSSAVLVALIGRQWATLTDEDGVRRLDNPDDYVRFELKTALERGVRVIPVLIDGAKPLRQQDLPAELHKLARLNAHKLSYDRYQDDASRLLDLIQRVLATVGEEPPAEWERELPDRKGDGADMTLRTEGAAPRRNPSMELIQQVVAQLTPPDGGNSFLIIEREDQLYAQAARNGANDYQVEYRDGDATRHFAAYNVTLAEAQAALCGWAFDLPQWRERLHWTRESY